MADNETKVVIGADTGQLASGMKQAETVVDTSAAHIQASVQKMSTDIMGSVGRMQAQLKSHFEMVGSTIHAVTGVIAAVSAIVAGGKMFKEAIDETIKWTGEAVKLSKQFGITTEQASILNVALAGTRNTTETASAASSMLTRTMRTNEDAFKKLGVATRDQDGHYRNTFDVMMEVNAQLAKLKTGFDQNTAGMGIYGRRWDEIRGLLRLTSEQYEHAKHRAEELHLIVGPEGVKQMAQYKQAQVDIKEVMHSVEIMVGNAVLPTFIQLGSWFGSIGPQAVEVFKFAMNALASALVGLTMSFIWLYEQTKAIFQMILQGSEAFARTFHRIMAGDFAGAWAEAKAGFNTMADTGSQAFKRVVDAAGNSKEALLKIWGLKKSDIPASMAPEGENYDAKKDKDGKEESRLSFWKSELEKWKEAQGDYFREFKQQELEYWESALKLTKAGSEEQFAVRHEIFQLKKAMAHDELAVQIQAFKAESEAALQGSQERISIAQREAELIKSKYGAQSKEYAAMLREIERLQREYEADQRRRADIQAEQYRDLGKIAVDIERDKVAHLHNIGAMSDSQQIQEQKALLDQEFALDKTAMEAKLANARQGSIEELQLYNQLEVANARHAQSMTRLNQQAAAAATKPWRDMITSITSGFADAITNMIMYGGRFGDFMRKLAIMVVGEMVGAFVRMGMQWVSEQIMMTLFGQTQEQARASARAAAAAQQLGITKATNIDLVLSQTAVASMGAASAMAAIPIIGPALATAAAEEMTALGMEYLAMASAAGGYDIPQGVNPVTQLHQKEMVLPANLAEKVRNMTDTPQQAVSTNVNFHVSAIDAKSVKKFFREHGQALASSLGAQQRNFAMARG